MWIDLFIFYEIRSLPSAGGGLHLVNAAAGKAFVELQDGPASFFAWRAFVRYQIVVHHFHLDLYGGVVCFVGVVETVRYLECSKSQF